MTVSAAATAALNAYTATSKLSGGGKSPAQQGAGGGFADLVKQALDTVTETGAKAEKTSMDAVAGKVDMVEVVTAVAESELAVETLVTVRDRVISAYEEIMRMPI